MTNTNPKQSADTPTNVPPPLPHNKDTTTPSVPAQVPAASAKHARNPPSSSPDLQSDRNRTLLPRHFLLLITHLASRLGFRGAVICLALVPLLLLMIYETFAPGIQFEVQPIEVPSQHIDAGYAPHVLALHLIDEIRRIRNATQTTTMHHTDAVIGESTIPRGNPDEPTGRATTLLTGANTSGIDLSEALPSVTATDYGPDFVVPAVGISLRSTAAYIRDRLRLSPKITGELTSVNSTDTVALRLRIDGERIPQVCLMEREGSVDQVLNYGAIEILCTIQPLTLASYYYSTRDLTLIPRLIARARLDLPDADTEARALVLEGRLAALRGDLDEAIQKYSEAVAHDPGSLAAFSSWGNALRTRRQYDDAIEKYRRALGIDDTFAPAYRDWGNVLYLQQDYEGAIAKYRRALKYDPASVRTYTAWANALRQREDYVEATATYQRALMFDETFWPAYNGLGTVLLLNGDYDGAIQRYQTALTHNPSYFIAYYNWGEALHEMGRYEAAIGRYALAVEYNPGFVSAHRAWGEALCAMNDHGAAQEKFQKVQELTGEAAPTCPEPAG